MFHDNTDINPASTNEYIKNELNYSNVKCLKITKSTNKERVKILWMERENMINNFTFVSISCIVETRIKEEIKQLKGKTSISKAVYSSHNINQ